MNDDWDDDDDLLEDEEPSPELLLHVGLLFEFALAALAVFLGWLFSQRPVAGLGFLGHEPEQIGLALLWGVAATIPMLVLFGLIDFFGKSLFADLDQIVNQLIRPLFSEVNLFGLLVVSIAAGVGEEMLFRGFLQGMLADFFTPPYGHWAAILVAAYAFGCMHYFSLNYLAVATLMGCYLGALYLWTDSLLVPIVTHALYDFVALVYITRIRSGDDDDSE